MHVAYALFKMLIVRFLEEILKELVGNKIMCSLVLFFISVDFTQVAENLHCQPPVTE